MNRNAIVMGGGKGTRMKSDLPKVLHELLGEPLLAHSIATLKEAGAQRIVTITGYRYDLVQEVMAGTTAWYRSCGHAGTSAGKGRRYYSCRQW